MIRLSMVGFTIILEDFWKQLLAILVLVKCPSPSWVPDHGFEAYLPMLFTHSLDIVWDVPGHIHTLVGVHTTPLRPTLLFNPLQFGLVSVSTRSFVAMRRYCWSFALSSTVQPLHWGLARGSSLKQIEASRSSTQHALTTCTSTQYDCPRPAVDNHEKALLIYISFYLSH